MPAIIQEVPSTSHNIAGVATSIAAFIGWSNQGAVGRAVMVESWAQYQAMFGGMIPGIYLGYAVYQFFLNGGLQAYVIRLYDSPTAVTASNTIGGLNFSANAPGAWGNNIYVALTGVNATSNTFNLNVFQVNGSQSQLIESYIDLAITSASAQFAPTVINDDSNYITLAVPSAGPPLTIPLPTATAASGVTLNGTTTGSDGTPLIPSSSNIPGSFETALTATSGYALLKGVPLFNILCVPGETSPSTVAGLQQFCWNSRAMLIVDSAQSSVVGTGSTGLTSTGPADSAGTSLINQYDINSAFYFPWVFAADPASGNRRTLFPPSGFVAGIYASTDASRGVWKAPAGIGASLSGALDLQYVLNDQQNGRLNTWGINCLRQFPNFGNVVWGSRTMAGKDSKGSQWQYIPIRRLALFIESSLYTGTQWSVFEPNAEPLWSQVRLSIGAFLQGLFLQGAFAGTTPNEAYFVKCDSDNNTATTPALGTLNVTVGFAPLYPAEFVVIQIQQMMNQS